MSYAKQLLDTAPGTVTVDASVMAAAIDALSDCAQACTADTSADLSEQNLAEMVKCIRLCLDCADVCTATARVISRLADDDPGRQQAAAGSLRGHLQELR
jgi:ferredoxin